VRNGVRWFRLGIESGGFKQCDTFLQNFASQLKYALAVETIDGSVELNLDLFRLPGGIKVCLWEKLLMVYGGFPGVQAWLFYGKREARTKCARLE